MELVDAVYSVNKGWPREEVFGLTNQIRRASVSVPSNIAEGHGRKGDGDFQRFLSIAYGSLMEVKTQLLIGQRQQYSTETEVSKAMEAVNEIARMLNGLKKSIEQRKRTR